LPDGVEGQERSPYRWVEDLRKDFKRVADTYAQALPMEFGIAADSLSKRLGGSLPDHLRAQMPLPEELFGFFETERAALSIRGID
jgi:hypothetical protein